MLSHRTPTSGCRQKLQLMHCRQEYGHAQYVWRNSLAQLSCSCIPAITISAENASACTFRLTSKKNELTCWFAQILDVRKNCLHRWVDFTPSMTYELQSLHGIVVFYPKKTLCVAAMQFVQGAEGLACNAWLLLTNATESLVVFKRRPLAWSNVSLLRRPWYGTDRRISSCLLCLSCTPTSLYSQQHTASMSWARKLRLWVHDAIFHAAIARDSESRR